MGDRGADRWCLAATYCTATLAWKFCPGACEPAAHPWQPGCNLQTLSGTPRTVGSRSGDALDERGPPLCRLSRVNGVIKTLLGRPKPRSGRRFGRNRSRHQPVCGVCHLDGAKTTPVHLIGAMRPDSAAGCSCGARSGGRRARKRLHPVRHLPGEDGRAHSIRGQRPNALKHRRRWQRVQRLPTLMCAHARVLACSLAPAGQPGRRLLGDVQGHLPAPGH